MTIVSWKFKILSIVFFSCCCVFLNSDQAVSQAFPENNDGYVDADIVPNQGAVAGGSVVSRPTGSWDKDDQIQTGLLNYGYSESVYYQFSGESIFQDGNNLSGYPFTNWSWTNLNQLDFKVPPAWALGVEFFYFSSTSDSVYTGEGETEGSSINMSLYMLDFFVKMFFFDPVDEFVHPYFGVGWGAMIGGFDGKKTGSGEDFSTSFIGPYSYQVLGIQVKISADWGLSAEFKNLRGTATTSSDPFDQAEGDSVELLFDGVIVGLTGYYRF